jgi:uncharacterized protein
MNNIKKTIVFLQEQFEQSNYYKTREAEKDYRLNHTYRVARIGRNIARQEGLNEEALIIGCLLHDLAYIEDFTTKEEHLNHGRRGAELAQDFLQSLDIEDNYKDQILYGIASHVDGNCGNFTSKSVLGESISDCDNIDRFRHYRLYEALVYSDLNKKNLNDQIQFCEDRIERLEQLKEHPTATAFAGSLWKNALHEQIMFYKKLSKQLQDSDYNILY